MVLLAMTPGIVRALGRVEAVSPDDFAELRRPEEPALTEPRAGNPISHVQLIDLSKLLKKHATSINTHDLETKRGTHANNDDVSKADTKLENTSDHNIEQPTITSTPIVEPTPTTLSALLHGTQIYIPPAPTIPTKSPQYLALMSRLRAEEEARSYSRMLHPPPTRETFNQRFPSAPAFSLGSNLSSSALDDDDTSYDEVHRQIILIINILVSIVCVAVFIWIAARHWSVGKRLGLSMAGSFGIAVAEVAVYGGYVRKVREAKMRERKKPEIKEIVQSWVLHKGVEEEDVTTTTGGGKGEGDVRRRKGKHR